MIFELNCNKTPCNFYTYMHTSTKDNSVFYVGKGSGRRAWVGGRSKQWHAAASGGYRVDLLGHFNLEADAYTHEVFLIQCFKAMGAKLANRTLGGAWCAGQHHIAEVCKEMSIARSGEANVRYGKPGAMLGRKMPKGFAELARAANTGKKLSDETKAKISLANRGRPSKTKGVKGVHGEAALEKIRSARAKQVMPPMSASTKERVSTAKKAYWAAWRKERAL